MNSELEDEHESMFKSLSCQHKDELVDGDMSPKDPPQRAFLMEERQIESIVSCDRELATSDPSELVDFESSSLIVSDRAQI